MKFSRLWFYYTALTKAAQLGNSEAVKVLLEREDVNVNIKSISKLKKLIKFYRVLFLISFYIIVF